MVPKLTLQKEKILELETRKIIYQTIRKNPGLHFRELERKIKMPYGTLKYNLNFLIKHELIKSKVDRNNVRYFLKEFSIDDENLLGLLRQESIRKILLFMVANKKVSNKKLLDFMGLAPSTISWHLKKLLAKGIISRDNSKKSSLYSLVTDKEKIMKLIISYKNSFLDSLVNRTIEMWDIS